MTFKFKEIDGQMFGYVNYAKPKLLPMIKNLAWRTLAIIAIILMVYAGWCAAHVAAMYNFYV